jgi:hypothetical protein
MWLLQHTLVQNTVGATGIWRGSCRGDFTLAPLVARVKGLPGILTSQ